MATQAIKRGSLVLMLALCGCGKESPSPFDGAQRGASKDNPAGSANDLPWSEGTANKMLRGKTDDEVKALVGAPDHAGFPPDGSAEQLWSYTKKIYIKPPEGSHNTVPDAMGVYFVRGQVTRVVRQ